MKIKAIYINDLNYENAPVFVYNESNRNFEHELKDEDETVFFYPSEVIYFDNNWIVFIVKDEVVTKITKEELVKLIRIDFDGVDEDDFS